MIKVIASLLTIALLFPASVSAEKIVLAALPDFPPFQYEENGQLTGPTDLRSLCRTIL